MPRTRTNGEPRFPWCPSEMGVSDGGPVRSDRSGEPKFTLIRESASRQDQPTPALGTRSAKASAGECPRERRSLTPPGRGLPGWTALREIRSSPTPLAPLRETPLSGLGLIMPSMIRWKTGHLQDVSPNAGGSWFSERHCGHAKTSCAQRLKNRYWLASSLASSAGDRRDRSERGADP